MTGRPLLALALLVSASLLISACGPSAGTNAPSGPAQTSSAATPAGTAAPPAATASPRASAAASPAASAPASAAASPQSSGAAGSPIAGAPTCPDTARDQTIEMWSPFTGPDGTFMTALADRYSQENGMGITVSHVPQADYMLSLNNAAGHPEELPEMIAARVINVGELAARHVLQPFTPDVMAVVGEDLASDIPENLWVRGEYNGERYSIPLDTHMLVMYYNKEMFTAANVTEPADGTPWTSAEFDAALTALEGSGVEPIAIGNGFQAGTLFQTFIVQFGGSLTNEEGTQVTYNSDQGVQAMEYLVQLRDKGAPDISGTGDPEVNVFKAKGAAIVMHGPWHISGMEALTDIDVGYAPMPQVGSQYGVWAGSHQLALTSTDPAAQAAAGCWIRWLSDNSIEWAAAGQFPARESVRNDPALATEAPAIARVAAVVDKAIILPQVPELEGALWGQGFGPVVDRVLAGEVTGTDAIRTALDDAAAISQQLIDDAIERYANVSPAP